VEPVPLDDTNPGEVTPFVVLEPSGSTCRANLAQLDATLFPMNHWVQRIAPSRIDAATANAHEFIVDRPVSTP
jgi:hypothetical protein